MNVLDIIVIAVVLLSGLFAFARGFVKEALSVAAWVGAAFAALYGLPYAAPLAERFLPKGPVADAAAGFALFLVALVILSFITSAIAGHVKKSALSAVDRTLGLVFGLVRGLVLVCLAYIALSWALPAGGQAQPSWIAQAKTLPLLANGAERLRQLVPASYLERAGSKISEARRAAEQVEQVKEAAGAMGALSTPHQNTPSTREHEPGYTPDARHDLDRLIQQQQDSH
jgi:membrane protein required for colicin V production